MGLVEAGGIRWRYPHPEWDDLLSVADEIAADSTRDTYDDDARVETEREARADGRRSAIRGHDDEGADERPVENGVDEIREHVEINGALGDQGHRRGIGAAICVARLVACAGVPGIVA